jgi:hypothetical protein
MSRGATPVGSMYKGKRTALSTEELSKSGIRPPGAGYFASRSNISLVDPGRILRSASSSSIHLAHPMPLRHLPSASNLMRSNSGNQYNPYRAPSSSSVYSSRPSSRASSFNDLPAYVAAASSNTLPARSAWTAIHPPTHTIYHSSSINSLRSVSSAGSLSQIKQLGQRARSSPSSSSSGRGSPLAQHWGYQRGHKATSSQSSSLSGSSKLDSVAEEDDVITPVNDNVPAMWSRRQASPPTTQVNKGKGKQSRYRPRPPSPESNRRGASPLNHQPARASASSSQPQSRPRAGSPSTQVQQSRTRYKKQSTSQPIKSAGVENQRQNGPTERRVIQKQRGNVSTNM